MSRAEMVRDNWRNIAAGCALFFVIGVLVDGIYAGLVGAAVIVLCALVVLAIGDD